MKSSVKVLSLYMSLSLQRVFIQVTEAYTALLLYTLLPLQKTYKIGNDLEMSNKSEFMADDTIQADV